MPEIENAGAAPPPPPATVAGKLSSMDNDSDYALFGKYEVGRLLGCGAFAKVYHGRNVSTGQSVAVKVITKSKIIGENNLMSNIKREISIMHRLHHRHIVKLLEVLATKTKIYFVMEFVKGGELFDKIAKGKQSEDLSRRYFQQLISTVGYCHSRGVYHRDLKPENLLLDENGDLKVSDFGLSAVTGQVRHDGLLHTLCGTPAYVAPEVLAKKGYDGAKVDIWSCGVILFVLTAGYLPFNDPNLMMMYKKIYKGDFRCPKWMSSDLKRLIHRLLDTNPQTRITIDETIKHPWLNKNPKEISFYDEEIEDKKECKSCSQLNAFDIISFSSGLNLTCLFDDSIDSIENLARFISAKSPEEIIERVEQLMKDEIGIKLRKTMEWGIELKGQNGKFFIGIEVYPLTDSLVVVEVRRSGMCNELWDNKIKPLIT